MQCNRLGGFDAETVATKNVGRCSSLLSHLVILSPCGNVLWVSKYPQIADITRPTRQFEPMNGIFFPLLGFNATCQMSGSSMKTTRTLQKLMRSARKVGALARVRPQHHTVGRLIQPGTDLAALSADFDQRRSRDQGTEDFLDTSQFDWIQEIETLAGEIARESRVLLQALALVPGYSNSRLTQPNPDDCGWGTMPLLNYGRRIKWLSGKFPATDTAISRVPGSVSAMFSVLQPGQQFGPHSGPHSATLQYQLAAHIPASGECGIRVADRTHHWEPGQSLVINDYREHTAWNGSDEPMVVFLVDFKRAVAPSMRPQREHLIKQFSSSNLSRGISQTFNQWVERHGDDFEIAIERARDAVDAADRTESPGRAP